MDAELQARFVEKWEGYFPGSELPIACYYADDLNGAEFPTRPSRASMVSPVFSANWPL